MPEWPELGPGVDVVLRSRVRTRTESLGRYWIDTEVTVMLPVKPAVEPGPRTGLNLVPPPEKR